MTDPELLFRLMFPLLLAAIGAIPPQLRRANWSTKENAHRLRILLHRHLTHL